MCAAFPEGRTILVGNNFTMPEVKSDTIRVTSPIYRAKYDEVMTSMDENWRYFQLINTKKILILKKRIYMLMMAHCNEFCSSRFKKLFHKHPYLSRDSNRDLGTHELNPSA